MSNTIVNIHKEKPFHTLGRLMLQTQFPPSLLPMHTSVMTYMCGFFVCLAFVSCETDICSWSLKVDRMLVLLFQGL